MKKLFSLLLAVLMLSACLVGCVQSGNTPGNNSETTPGGDPGTTPGEPAGGVAQELTVCTGPDPETIDPALNSSVDGAIMLSNAFSGLYQWHTNEDGTQTIIADCAQEVVEPTQLDDGTYQYVITLKEGLKWSDGTELKASDFTYSWNRAVDPNTLSDYQYIFDVIAGYSDTTPELAIAADDAARTITIVTSALCPYFNQLMAFPTYFPVRKDIVEANPDDWTFSADTYVSNGAFKMAEWTVGDKIVFVRNENYWNAANVKLDKLTFALSSDDDAIFANFENGTYQYTTTVPISQIPVLKNDPNRMNVDFFIGDYSGTYFLQFNVEQSFKPGIGNVSDDPAAWTDWTPAQNAEVRHALGLLIDRNYIVDSITQGGQLPAYGFVPAGMDDGTGTEFRAKAEKWWSVDPADKEANIAEALDILKKYYTFDEATGTFTDFPVFEYSVNPTSGNLAMCAAIQDMWDDYGITVSVDQRDWAVIQTALSNGDFTMSRLGWIADYIDPITFLEIYVAASGNNHPRLGKDGAIGSAAVYGNGSQTWNEAYEQLIATIKTSSDIQARADAMYQAEKALMDTYAVIPIYYYTNPYLAKTNVKDFLYSPLGFVYFRTAYIEG